MLYSVALATGLRRDELKSITPESFTFNRLRPSWTCWPDTAKMARKRFNLCPRRLAVRLAHWLAVRPSGEPVFGKMSKRIAETLARDLEAAGIAPKTDSGVIDFHALRGTYISHLVVGAASVKTCQTLARHSSPSLTIGIYAKASLHDIQGAVEALPDLTPGPRRPEAWPRPGQMDNA